MRPILETVYTWLITTAVGSLLFTIYLWATEGGGKPSDAGLIFIVAFPVSLLFSSPGMAVYHLCVLFIRGRAISETAKRIYRALVAFFTTYGSVVTVFGISPINSGERVLTISLAFALPYLLPFIFCALLFDYLPQVPPSPDENVKKP